MSNSRAKHTQTQTYGYKKANEYRALSNKIFEYANRSLPRVDFLHDISIMLMDFFKCNAADLWLKEGEKYCHCGSTYLPKKSFSFQMIPFTKNKEGDFESPLKGNSSLGRLCQCIFLGHIDPCSMFIVMNSNFSSEDSRLFGKEINEQMLLRELSEGGEYESIAMIPLLASDGAIGLLLLKSNQMNFFKKVETDIYKMLAQDLGMAIINQTTHAALLERVKELTCLYDIAQIARQSDMTTEDVLKHIVDILPNAWQYPDIASSRIVFDDHTYETQNFQESQHKQTTCIFVEGKQRGTVEVIYKEEKPELDEGPFLKEERALIDNVARQIALIIERKEAEEAKSKLKDELRHADRLSTIGQLTTEVAHDLNEPLGNILGFAQLVKKSSNLTNQVDQDIDKIINASLHAREVIRRLMIFGRQMPPMKTNVNMNQVVEESCYFIESRCVQAGVKLVRSLSRDLPEITADPSQIKQTLVNLLVNSLQAMPEGGELKVKTSASKNCVSLVVQDTGIGMSEEVKKKIFIPFFTTKGIGQGTGLGLAVVHSIVTSYKGSIKVESEPDCGTRFEIKLPLKAE